MRLPRVLMLTEASFLSTGYSSYSRELLSRLYNTGKYEVAEVSVYGHAGDERFNQIPWKCYLTTPQSPEEEKEYYSNITNEFGEYKINDILLDFKPDFVLGFKDFWMDSFLFKSPYRRLFRLIYMAIVDSAPQNIEWIDTYNTADALLTYSEWAQNYLKSVYDKLPLKGTASPCGNTEIFKPCINKRQHRKKYGLDENAKIFGTVMRNQPRKQYLDLANHFCSWLDKTGYDDCFLYFHCSVLDVGWNMADIVKNCTHPNKILFSYKCAQCDNFEISYFQDAVSVCSKCKQAALSSPGTQNGVSPQELSDIYNLFDVYIQYATNEGFGIPIVEAASCGIPSTVINFSAMCDFVSKLGSIPMEPKTLISESATHRKFATMDENELHKSLDYFIGNWKNIKQLGMKTKILSNKNYNWDNTAKVWMNIIDGFNIEDRWNLPPNFHNPAPSELIPMSEDLSTIVKWMLVNVAGRPDLLNTSYHARLLRDVLWQKERSSGGTVSEMSLQRPRLQDFKLQDCYNSLRNMREDINRWEQKRIESLNK